MLCIITLNTLWVFCAWNFKLILLKNSTSKIKISINDFLIFQKKVNSRFYPCSLLAGCWCSCAHLLCGECIVIPDDSPDAGLGFRASSEPESRVSVTQMSVTSTSQDEQSATQDSLLPPGPGDSGRLGWQSRRWRAHWGRAWHRGWGPHRVLMAGRTKVSFHGKICHVGHCAFEFIEGVKKWIQDESVQ